LREWCSGKDKELAILFFESEVTRLWREGVPQKHFVSGKRSEEFAF
jgi:hypothetical protein